MQACALPVRDRSAAVRPRGEEIRVRGMVQGVGFRPAVWRLAHDCGLSGSVRNDSDGVQIRAWGDAVALDRFIARLRDECPPLARIDAIERRVLAQDAEGADLGGFRIVASVGGPVRTGVVPDAVVCSACIADIGDPLNRRYRYPFANCTHCGPRLSIVRAIPYDRANTAMAAFPMCPACLAEYEDPADRRFHAQPLACAACGPHVWLEHTGGPLAAGPDDAIRAAWALLRDGGIVAIKGIGGFQLACDACNPVAVARLRQRKRRERKPFALMARDLAVIRQYSEPTAAECGLLQSPAAPIVIVQTRSDRQGAPLAPDVAPGIAALGFMLPGTPLHWLLMAMADRPIVLTSGNASDEPQCTENADARMRLGAIADAFLMHDRDVVRRVDDSVARVVLDVPRVMRRSRGYAPAPLPLPPGFAAAAPVLAMGGELKNTFCLMRAGEAILSHHMGDLEDALTHADYRRALTQYMALFEHDPHLVAVDMHPEYLSGKIGRDLARQGQLPVAQVQHHHAHIAACMAENRVALAAGPVLGVALDGIGYGVDGSLWGGEFLLADYRDFTRLARFKPVGMPGGERAIHQPWRNTYAHLAAAVGWDTLIARHASLALVRFLATRPREVLDAMLTRSINSPLASSAGRLFDAVAAAAGVCPERACYEGQAAMEFEALADRRTLSEEDDGRAYPFAIVPGTPVCLEPGPMWVALLADLARATPAPLISARFHKGLAIAIASMVAYLADCPGAGCRAVPVALSGGVFQNRILLEQVATRLSAQGRRVLTHSQVPANDGGLSFGQAAIAAARSLGGADVAGQANAGYRSTTCA
ncbi:carbamoyltransferase HypF (plasmid) [Cupriavidus necator]|uniref:carbamoyltransferase HypF n=1 Tax=Cupriavidus necator TaxID=106590 RepID=UPI003F739091